MTHTYEITARSANGSELHAYHARTEHDAAGYIRMNAQASFVDGFTVEGVGIMRIERGPYGELTGFRAVRAGEFATIGTSFESIREYIESERSSHIERSA